MIKTFHQTHDSVKVVIYSRCMSLKFIVIHRNWSWSCHGNCDNIPCVCSSYHHHHTYSLDEKRYIITLRTVVFITPYHKYYYSSIVKEKAVYMTANQAYGLHSIGPSHGHTATTVQGETGPVYEEVNNN